MTTDKRLTRYTANTLRALRTACVFVCLALAAGSAGAQALPDPIKILDRVEEEYRYGNKDLSSTVTLIVEKPDTPKETLQFKLFQRDRKEQFTMVQLLPESDKGAGYMREGDNLWYYDPIGRKFSHSSIKENIGDSDAKTSDMTSQYSYKDDYDAVSIEAGKLGAYPVWIITLQAKTSRPAYAKLVYYIRQDIPIILKTEDFSANGRLMRTLLFPKYTQVDGKYIATQAIIRDEINKGEQTQQIVSDISFAPVPDKVFSKAYLEQLN